MDYGIINERNGRTRGVSSNQHNRLDNFDTFRQPSNRMCVQQRSSAIPISRPPDPARPYNSVRHATVTGDHQDFRSFSTQVPRHRRPPISDNIMWSKGTDHFKEAVRTGVPESFRKATRLLQDMVSLDWLEQFSASQPKDKYVVKSARPCSKEDIGTVHENVWKAFVYRDNYMDLVKKFNSSNIELLKNKQRHDKGLICPSDYDFHIRRCVDNPGILGGTVYSVTWNMLRLLIDEKDLKEYAGKCAYSERGLNICKLDADLLERLNIRDKSKESEKQHQVSNRGVNGDTSPEPTK